MESSVRDGILIVVAQEGLRDPQSTLVPSGWRYTARVKLAGATTSNPRTAPAEGSPSLRSSPEIRCKISACQIVKPSGLLPEKQTLSLPGSLSSAMPGSVAGPLSSRSKGSGATALRRPVGGASHRG